MRKLQTQDVFKAIKVINSADLKTEFKQIVEMAREKKTSVSELGFDIIFKLLEKVSGSKTELEIYEFLSGPLECSVKEVKEMDIISLVTGLKDCADFESWKVFFKSVSALTTR
ncbi:hypothetical protein ACTQ6A_13960 [Lachnospiraceae bacterium LCP25S3_G4]